MAEPSNPPSSEVSSMITDPKARLTDLTTRASQKYGMKDYNAASDLYAQATELQAELNGEMAVENADLLYLYGRSLYQVGVSKSDVLGAAKTGGDPDVGGGASSKKETAQNAQATTSSVKGEDASMEGSKSAANKPFFQFTGDENWDASDNEEDGDEEDAAAAEEGGNAEEEEEDDFTAAWESLDLARLLFDRKLQGLLESAGDETAAKDSAEMRHVKERLADAHDLLAEISLEHENFSTAVSDFRVSLSLKKELYPPESGIIAEAHYKLSLALEFGSSTSTEAPEGDSAGLGGAQTNFDKAGRDEAAQHMEAAIHSAKLRLKKEEEVLASATSDERSSEQKRVSKEGIQDLKEMIADMEQRLIDLRAPPVMIDPATGAPADAGDSNSHPLAGILSSVLGASPAEQRAKLEEVMKGANDLTGLVKRKKPEATAAKEAAATEQDMSKNQVNGHKKRKAEQAEEDKDKDQDTRVGDNEPAKKAKVEE